MHRKEKFDEESRKKRKRSRSRSKDKSPRKDPRRPKDKKRKVLEEEGMCSHSSVNTNIDEVRDSGTAESLSIEETK